MAKKEEDESDDTFGLPEIEYQPINREAEPEQSSQEQPEEQTYSYQQEEQASSYDSQSSSETESAPNPYSYSQQEEEPQLWPKVLGILLVVAIAVVALLYFMWYKPKQEEEKKLLAEKQKKEQEAAMRERERLAEEERIQAIERRKADSLAAIPKIGVYEALNSPTGRYYVVIASAVDGDLIMDHAKKLSKDGVSTKIIPPFGKFKFYRLTIAEGDSYAEAQDIAETKKADFGDAVWVLRY
jgi:hypothetical protein